MGSARPPGISLIIPCHNEGENVDPLLEQLLEILPSLGAEWELLFVDDASTDDTVDRLRRWFGRVPQLRLLRHARKSGQSACLWTGFQRARGEVLVTMDGDLQNDPADIPRLLERLETCDMVCAVRVNRRDGAWRRFTSRIANWYRRTMLGDRFRDTGCIFRAFHRKALEGVPPFRGFHRFLPTLCVMNGFRVVEIPAQHRPRERGVSKYGTVNRMWAGIYDTFGMLWYRKRRLPMDRFLGEESGAQKSDPES